MRSRLRRMKRCCRPSVGHERQGTRFASSMLIFLLDRRTVLAGRRAASADLTAIETNAYSAAVLEVELESAPCLVSMAPRRASPRKQTLDRRMPTYERPVIVEWNPSQALVMRASHRPRSSKAQKPR